MFIGCFSFGVLKMFLAMIRRALSDLESRTRNPENHYDQIR
jgi:hypothetical protein